MLTVYIFFPESGRFIHQQKGLMERTYISDAANIGTVGKCVAIYRLKNKAVDIRNVADVSNGSCIFFNVEELFFIESVQGEDTF